MLEDLKSIKKEPSRAFINFFRIEAVFGACFIFFLSLFAHNSGEIKFNVTYTLSSGIFLFILFLCSFFLITWLRTFRLLAYFTYFLTLAYTVFVAYDNEYNLHSFSALVIGYTFFLISLYEFKAFIRGNTLFVILIIVSLAAMNFETIVDVRLIIFSLLIVSGFGGIMAYSRKYMAERIRNRGGLINHIINNSRQGLMLIDAEKEAIIEINSTAIKQLELDDIKNIKGLCVQRIELWNKRIFSELSERNNLIVENEEGKTLTVLKTKAKADRRELYLLEINVYSKEKEYDEGEELKKVKLISEENYENLFKNSASFICIINRQGKIIDVNNTIVKESGYPRAAFIGKKYNWHDAKNYEEEREGYNRKAWNGETQIFEKSLIAKEGRIIEIEVILKRGKYLGEEVFISNSRDISKRKELEGKIALRTRTYKNLIENSSIAIAFTDLDGDFIDFNKAFSDYLEYDHAELLKMGLNDVVLKLEWKDEKENLKKLLKEEIRAKETQIKFKTKKGKTKHALLKYMLQQKDNDKQSPKVIHQVVDVSTIVETRDKLKESEQSYKNLFDYSNELLYMVDENNQFVDVNQTVIDRYGYKKSELINENAFILSAPEKNDPEKVMELVKNVWNGKTERMLWWSITRTGEIFPKDLYMRKGNYFGKEMLIASGRDMSRQFEYEKMLKESRKKYKDLIDSSSWGILIFRGNKIVFTNKKALSILRVESEEELFRKSQYDFVKRRKDIAIFEKRIEKLRHGKAIPLSEYTLLDGEGNEIIIELKVRIVEYEQKECVLVSFIDINDRREIEKAKKKMIEAKMANQNLKLQLEQNRQIQIRLQNEQSYSKGVIESSLDMIFTTDKNGKLEKLNSAAKEKLGMRDEDYFGMSLNILFDGKKTGEKIIRELKDKKFFRGEVEMKKKGGKKFIAYASFSYLFNADNDFLGTMGISRDISEIKKQEKEIKEQAAKLNTIIESSSHYFFTIDKEFRFTSINRRLKEDAKRSYNANLKVEGSFFELLENIPKEKRERYIKAWKKNFEKCFNGHMVEFETENLSSDGENYFREVYLSPIYSEKGIVEEISGIGHDTTDKKLYEKELKKSLKEKEVLLQEVHHRVKNNMQVISSILNLQGAYVNDKKLHSILNDSQDRIRAMAAIHERLYRTKNFSDIKFSTYIKNLAENLVNSYEYGEAQIELTCELDEIFLTLDTSIPCGLIVNELISNALKYAFIGKEKGEIKISLKKRKEQISIEVSDNGSGFSKEVDFKNIDSLGLQLVATLVDQIEGKLEMNQEKGSSFRITFEG